MIHDQFYSNGRTINLQIEDEEANAIKYYALDSVCLKYKIEEEQLKNVLYVNLYLTSLNTHNAAQDNY